MEARIVISYRELANILKLNSNKIECLISHVKTKFKLDSDELEIVLAKIRLFYANFNKKLVKCGHSYQNILRDPWMHGKINIVLKKKCNLKRKVVGRPAKKFEECTARTKRRKVQEICAILPKDQIERAAIRNVKKPVAKIVRHLMYSTVPEVKEYCYKASRVDVIPLTETEAVSMLIELDLSKHQYQTIQNLSKNRNADIYPPYNKMLEAKKQCYPDALSIEVDENGASIKLQALLNHTAKRLLQSLSHDEILKLPTNLTLLSKYGSDGASGQSRYKQSFKANTEDVADDSKIFMSSLVPLRIVDEADSKTVHWQNDRPGSPRYCRPIKYMFANECKERTVEEIRIIKEQIKNLEASTISIGEKRFLVGHKLFLSMIDGKTCSYLTDTDSSTTCVICKATPNEMNDVKRVSQKTVDESFYEFGLSPLHAKIRFMEFVLHLGYNMPFKKWTASVKDGYAELKKVSKQRMQDEFREKMGLLVDIVKQGSGTTNDGNTARRFFASPEITASITKVDVNIIKRSKFCLYLNEPFQPISNFV